MATKKKAPGTKSAGKERAPAKSPPGPAERAPRAWLMKSEPSVFSIDDLAKAPGAATSWDGIRNYQARNLLRDQVRPGDRVLFYHSSADPTGVAGIAEVVGAAYPDPTQFDRKSKYHDPDSPRDAPRWLCVDVRLVERFPAVVTLAQIRAEPALAGMELLRRGNRLSVQPVRDEEFAAVLELASENRAGG
ncbi:MAG: hypothetical protein HMLKMBBP_01952 [Planctomycetes bacterium]|nr:hypothetical protein [Planctomycetota bacterium]